MDKLYIIITALLLSNILIAQNEPTYKTDEIIITSNKTSNPFLEKTRSVSIIKNSEIKLLPISSLSDLFLVLQPMATKAITRVSKIKFFIIKRSFDVLAKNKF